MQRTHIARRTGALGSLAALLALLLGPLAAGPASAHSGGRAVVLVRSLVVEPHGDAWHARALLTDNDSGSPIQGAKVTAAVGGAKPVLLTSAGVAGQFEGVLPKVDAGMMDLTLKVRAQPGAEPVLPFDGSWNAQLVAGQPLTIVGNSGDGSGAMSVVLGTVGGAAALGLLYGLYRARRRTAVPTPAH